jgi:hypothetical protein
MAEAVVIVDDGWRTPPIRVVGERKSERSVDDGWERTLYGWMTTWAE